MCVCSKLLSLSLQICQHSHLYDQHGTWIEQRCGAWPSVRCMEFNKYGKYPFGAEQTSVLRNREVSLIQRSSKYTFLWPTVRDSSQLFRITEVSVIRRAVIERLHCIWFTSRHMSTHSQVSHTTCPYYIRCKPSNRKSWLCQDTGQEVTVKRTILSHMQLHKLATYFLWHQCSNFQSYYPCIS